MSPEDVDAVQQGLMPRSRNRQMRLPMPRLRKDAADDAAADADDGAPGQSAE
jgi:hypothetical protein